MAVVVEVRPAEVAAVLRPQPGVLLAQWIAVVGVAVSVVTAADAVVVRLW